jgi:serine/threonine-protein kinase
MAYQSDESGRFEIYVRPFPDVQAGRWQVSNAGGTSPRWSPDGRELFYFDGQGISTVAVRTGESFSFDPPRPLFRLEPFGGRLGPDYELSRDGRRFLFIKSAPEPPPERGAHLVLVQRWMEEVKTRIAGNPGSR